MTVVLPAAPSDAEAIADINVDVWRDAYADLLPPAFLVSLSKTVRADAIRAHLSAGHAHAWIAAGSDRASGFVLFGKSRDAGAQPAEAEIHAIYVRRETWGNGTGSALLAAAENSLRGQGCRRIVIWVFERNASARRFYEKAGYAPDGRGKDLALGGVLLREVRYAKNLFPADTGAGVSLSPWTLDDTIEAVAPSILFRESYLAALSASRATGHEDFTLSHADLAETDFEAFLRRLQLDEEGAGLPDGHVPATHLWLVTPRREIVGIASVRHRLGPGNGRVGGHIGYCVPHAFRGRGYGRLCLTHALIKARALGIERVLITCSPENTASRRVIAAHGGVFESEVEAAEAGRKLRFWITLPPSAR